MQNRHDKRKAGAIDRKVIRAARKKCIACERTGRKMSREHFWPRWLAEYCEVKAEGITWINTEKRVDPETATIPLCKECNNRLGAELEGPVRTAMRDLEAGKGIDQKQAELLIRWMWKFEGLSACIHHLDDLNWCYSDRWTVMERVLDIDLSGFLPDLTLAIGMVNARSPGLEDWPMGLDSVLAGKNAIFVSGVFRRVALLVSLSRFDHLIPDWFGKYHFTARPSDSEEERFVPPICFPFDGNAIEIMTECSVGLFFAHEKFAQAVKENYPLHIVRNRLLIPNN